MRSFRLSIKHASLLSEFRSCLQKLRINHDPAKLSSLQAALGGRRQHNQQRLQVGMGSGPLFSWLPLQTTPPPTLATHHHPLKHNPRSALEFGAKAPESWQHKISSSDGVGGFTTFACPPTPRWAVVEMGPVSSFLAEPHHPTSPRHPL